ncbi:MAG: acetylesterase [Roseburia sp. CAG:10041_57]|nr:MAG: acetylesterase [Roseburia sp. CAG:10041_57]
MKIAHSVQATLTIYAHEDYPEVYGERNRPMIVICPGGGYEHVSPREGEAIALQFMTTGAHAAVLRYDVSGQGAEFPQHLLELSASVAYVRKHAAEYCIDPDKILLAGFSAGGHLAASLGCFWKEKWLEELMQAETGATMKDYQPNGEILAYPVITSGEFAHRGSFVKIMGSEAEQGYAPLGLSAIELEEKLSLENQVTSDFPQTFMWHTFEDGAVPLENSLFFAEALRKAGVNFEYHVFPHGGHGYALATKETAMKEGKEINAQCAQWIDLFKSWMKYNVYDI